LPVGDTDFSRRVGRMKVAFTHALRGVQAVPAGISSSRRKHRESDVWQRRFMEHTIRDEGDFERHLDYIHYNPVKHGLVSCPHAWPYLDIRRFL
jgi:putative transposase